MQTHIEGLEHRYLLAAGDIDTTFGVNGQLTLNVSAILPAGGDQFIAYNGAQLFKINADGSTVTSFADHGHTDVGAMSPSLVRVQSDGKLLVWDRPAEQSFGPLRRLNADGSVDSTFGNGGSVPLPGVSITELTEQADGKLLIANGNQILRLNANGSPDKTFHEFDFINFAPHTPILAQPDGKILIGGRFGSPDDTQGVQQWLIIRLNGDGTVDTSFAAAGKIPADGTSEQISAMALVPGGNGTFVALDNSHDLRRFTADGTADPSFESAPGVAVARTGLTEDADGNLLAAPGGRWVVWNEEGMMRLKADGTRDHAFGTLISTAFLAPLFTGAALTSAGDILTSFEHISMFQHEAAVGLRKIQGSGSTPPMVGVVGSTLQVTGTDGNEVIWVLTTNRTGIEVDISSEWEREFDRTGITQVSVTALGGNDGVYVQSLADLPVSVSGGDGNDTIIAQAGNDSLSGNAGNDKISGGGGDDRISGNGGRDRLDGGDGNDRIFGGAGGDWITDTGTGGDVVEGGDGNDVIRGGPGVDTIAGGNGNDTIVSNDGNVESIFGDGGNDSVVGDNNDILSSVETFKSG